MHLRVSTSTFAHVRLRVYICGHVCMLPCLRMCCVHIAHVHVFKCVPVHMYGCASLHAWTCVHACMSAHVCVV